RRLNDPVRFLGILVSQHLPQGRWNDLPRQAILVLQPAALIFSTTRGQLLPQLVYLLLCLTVHEQRDGRRELELRATVQGVELLSLELERRGHDRPLWPWPCRAVSRDAQRLRILEDRHIEIHRLFGLAVEPQERDDLLHRVLSIGGQAGGTGRRPARRRASRRPQGRSGTRAARVRAWRSLPSRRRRPARAARARESARDAPGLGGRAAP